MAGKRAAARPETAIGSSPWVDLWLCCGAVACGFYLLVLNGRMSWPPARLVESGYTLAGCIALIGPIVLARRGGSGEGGLGDLAWMTAGVLVWINDLAAVARGEALTLRWATPVAIQPMGLTILAVMIAGKRLRAANGGDWSWTNVVGWILACFWVGAAILTLVPSRWLIVASR